MYVGTHARAAGIEVTFLKVMHKKCGKLFSFIAIAHTHTQLHSHHTHTHTHTQLHSHHTHTHTHSFTAITHTCSHTRTHTLQWKDLAVSTHVTNRMC